MAILNGDGLTGGLGPAVFYVRKRKKLVRAKPKHYTDKKSVAQLFNREKMHLASRFIKAIKPFAKIGYQATNEDLYDNYSNEIRQFILNNCFKNDNGTPLLEYEKIKISRGEIRPPEEYSIQFVETPPPENGSVKVTGIITWKTPVEKVDWMLNLKDNVMLCMFSDSGDEGIAWMNSNMAERKDGTLSFPIPKSDKPIHFWMFFHNPNAHEGVSKKKISDSVYLGCI